MSDHHDSSSTSGLVPAAFVLVALLVPMFFALQGASKATAPTTSTAGGFDWPVNDSTTEKLKTERAKFFSTPLKTEALKDPKIKTLFERVYSQNNHMFTTAPIPTKTTSELIAQFQEGLTGAIEVVPNKKAYGQLVDQLVPKCMDALNGMMKDIKAGKLTIDQAIADPDINTYRIYRTTCGNLFGALKQFKLVDDKGQWRDAQRGPMIAELLQRRRWSMAAAPTIPITMSMAPSDRIAFLRWRIESPDAFSTKKRVAFLRRAFKNKLPYHHSFALALIYKDAKQWSRAKEALRIYGVQTPTMKPTINKWIAQMPATPPITPKKSGKNKKTKATKKTK